MNLLRPRRAAQLGIVCAFGAFGGCGSETGTPANAGMYTSSSGGGFRSSASSGTSEAGTLSSASSGGSGWSASSSGAGDDANEVAADAKTDPWVMNPKDIDTIIMGGGGNDVLIDNQGCLTNAQPPPANAACAMAIQGTVDRASKLLQEAAADGVKHVVYVFYPHLDPAGGGILPTPAPQVNATLDYAYPLAEQICCGSSFISTATSCTCSGNTSGTECVFIDIRPAFEGHVADYIKSDHVHPTDAGAKVIADLIAGAMRAHCIAQ